VLVRGNVLIGVNLITLWCGLQLLIPKTWSLPLP